MDFDEEFSHYMEYGGLIYEDEDDADWMDRYYMQDSSSEASEYYDDGFDLSSDSFFDDEIEDVDEDEVSLGCKGLEPESDEEDGESTRDSRTNNPVPSGVDLRTLPNESSVEIDMEQESKRPLCRFFVLGKCKYGSICKFSHHLPTSQKSDCMESAGKLIPCSFFLRDGCRYGDACAFRHDESDRDRKDNQLDETSDSELTCGICFDDILRSGKLFGLLKCDHCFCVECIRQWRGSKSMETAVTRLCPACRKRTPYIVPSRKFPRTLKEKREVVHAFEKHVAQIRCKKFRGKFGSCPFGRSCLYAHLNSQGIDVKALDQPKRRPNKRNMEESRLFDPFLMFIEMSEMHL